MLECFRVVPYMSGLSGVSQRGESSDRGSTGPSLRCQPRKPSLATASNWPDGRRPHDRPAMSIGIDQPMVIELKNRPTPIQANVLHILGEFPNRWVSRQDLCARLNTEIRGLKIAVCRLRKLLTVDWTIQNNRRDGYRLIDLRDK